MAFFIEVQVIVHSCSFPILLESDFSNLADVYKLGNTLKTQLSPGYVCNLNLSCLCELMWQVRT